MEYLTCQGGEITEVAGDLICSGTWGGVAMTEVAIAELDPASIAALLGAAMAVFAIAAGIRYCIKTMWR